MERGARRRLCDPPAGDPEPAPPSCCGRADGLVYATCTFAPEENEGSIWRFLQSHPDFELIEPTWRPGFMAGRPEWAEWPKEEGGGWRVEGGEWRVESGVESGGWRVDERMSLDRTIRLWPHKVQGEGHFVAVLQRREGAASRRGAPDAVETWEPARAARLSTEQRSAIEAFWQPLIRLALPDRLLLYERDSQVSEVFALPPDAPEYVRAPRCAARLVSRCVP